MRASGAIWPLGAEVSTHAAWRVMNQADQRGWRLAGTQEPCRSLGYCCGRGGAQLGRAGRSIDVKRGGDRASSGSALAGRDIGR